MKTYIFHSDAGHGWLAVKRDELKDMKILHKITGCSYEKGKTVYLEEDADCSTFDKRMKELNKEYDVESSKFMGDRSPIRSYPHFKMTAAESMSFEVSTMEETL
jgi:hypothetical protein